MNIVLLGAPGSGKGTQAQNLQNQIGFIHIATGDLFRKHLSDETELGLSAKAYIDKGELVPDTVTIDMLREELLAAGNEAGILFDGFPRNLEQAEALDTLLYGSGRSLDGVVYVRVSDEVILRRLIGRMICRECQAPFHKEFNPYKECPQGKCENGEFLYQRDDDKSETVLARLKTFHSVTTPLIEYYRARGLIGEVDGEGPVDIVAKGIERFIGTLS